ncbi:transglycosylase SLT domain-containing protein [Novosphingobium sp. P6W]|uniref:transglycosylase SLT domain-containing protein n=1 Tax=Novosphingobium sp. P6W TaxID=1609758 RepID=UPI000A8F46D7|nr:transglycosylase SLT domain-containing protein [Novosphingobium sp. P6W]
MSDGQVFAGIAARSAAGATSGGSQVRAAIAHAAEATGVDFQYLMAQAKLESSFDPSARAATSSAAGLYQFTSGTWLSTMGRHGAEHGMGWASDAIQGGTLDPATRAQVMGLRYDPQVSALMAGELAADNRADLTARLGREPDAAELYLAHFLGSAGAGQFLEALAQNPNQSAAGILPKAAAANRGIFFLGGAPRSVGSVMALMRGKVAGAMEGDFPPGIGGEWTPGSPSLGYESVALEAASYQPSGPIAREFNAGLPAAANTGQRSMADTLQAAFGTSGSAASGHVRDAYSKLARLGL